MDSANLNTANSMSLQPMGATPLVMHMPNVISSRMTSIALLLRENVFSSGDMQLSPGHDKYVKVWEGQGQPVVIIILEGYTLASVSKTKPTKHNPLYHICIMPNGYVVEMKMKSILTLGVGCRCPSVLYMDVKREVGLAA
ncbi:uncharacterized protein LOC113361615 isoform X2 [Papaver somniferum]|uniref:uncharacterized protein LOC113361615 isoform X2 n=1 Tax=Papaver somniferum TaxID=3469 RepID=UPI000E700404|nr:uncharacterized protein LOC113361615 isoform X2 [Papaver somniferum]